MSPREKKLLIFFAAAGFLVLNFLAIGLFQNKRLEVESQRNQARQKLDTAEMFRASREQVVDEMEWLAKHEPQPAANQDIQTQLQQLCEREARTAGLTIKTQKPLQTDTTGQYYHRAKIQLTVNFASHPASASPRIKKTTRKSTAPPPSNNGSCPNHPHEISNFKF